MMPGTYVEAKGVEFLHFDKTDTWYEKISFTVFLIQFDPNSNENDHAE